MNRLRLTRSAKGLLVGALSGAAACAPIPYTPIQLLSPSLEADSIAVLGPVRATLRLGVDWLELQLRNTGDAAVDVDWQGTALLAGDGHRYALIPASGLPDRDQRLRQAAAGWGDDESARFAQGVFQHPAAWDRGGIVASSPWTAAPGRGVASLPAGAAQLEVLYLARSLIGAGEPSLHQLLTRAPGPRREPFHVLIPARYDGAWHVLSISAVLR